MHEKHTLDPRAVYNCRKRAQPALGIHGACPGLVAWRCVQIPRGNIKHPRELLNVNCVRCLGLSLCAALEPLLRNLLSVGVLHELHCELPCGRKAPRSVSLHPFELALPPYLLLQPAESVSALASIIGTPAVSS